MSKCELNKAQLQNVLCFALNSKKPEVEMHLMIIETYGETSISERLCCKWFQYYKNEELEVKDKEHLRLAKKLF